MSKLASLKAATSLSDLAELLDFKPKAVSYILYKEPAATKYTTFQIPKRNGGQRTIKAPIEKLKLLQERLSDLLQDCVDEINSAKKRKDRAAHGFKRKRSIITNARRHRNRRWVFNVDLEDFFPSINFGRVRGFLIKSRDFELNERVATVVAQIACHDNALPQGSPCSPVISNLVGHLLDMRLVKLAAKSGCTYSRYADDLTFSTNKKTVPTEIAVPSGKDGAATHLWVPGVALQKVIARSGFVINSRKTHLMYRCSRQEVTGLVTNRKVNTRWEYRHNVRAMVHRLTTTGKFEVLGAIMENGQPVLKKRTGTGDELHGMLGFVDSIEAYNRSEAEGGGSDEMSASEKVYRAFLIYRTFYAAETPVIVCEGATDNVYLTHAIRSLAEEFPELAEVKPDGKIRLKVRLYKYRRSSTARLLGLKDGGSGVLSKFIVAYRKETGRFGGPGLTEPVVVLYDNDSGGKGIRKTIQQVTKALPTDADPFVRIVKNLYAAHTPGVAKIEDFFTPSLKATVVDGKTFNEENGIDTDTQYSKTVFAHRVVRPKADTIDFSGFRPLLRNLVGVIEKHKEGTAAEQPGA